MAFVVRLKTIMTSLLNGLLIVAVAALVLDVVWGVFTRYVMGNQALWTEELARFLLVWVSLIGGAVAFGTKGHLGVDYFVDKFDPSMQKTLSIVSNLIILFFAGSIFVYGGSRVVMGAMGQVTPALHLKMGYVYLALPISGIFMIIFTIENLIEIIAGEPPDMVVDMTIEEAS